MFPADERHSTGMPHAVTLFLETNDRNHEQKQTNSTRNCDSHHATLLLRLFQY